MHALNEAHRVLKANGILIDLRPRSARREVGIASDGNYQALGVVRRSIADVRAANHAVAHLARTGWFGLETRLQFNCVRSMDTPGEFQSWWNEFAHGPLDQGMIKKVEEACSRSCSKRKILVQMPLAMRRLRKRSKPS